MELKLPGVEIPDPDAAWAASGLMSLTGRADGPPLLAPPGVVVGLRRLAAAVGDASGVIVDGPALAGERAALAGLVRQGDVSCGGTTRLLQCTDGWLALTLARAADVELLPAWLEEDTSADDVAPRVAHRSAGTLMERAALLGLALARVGERSAPALRCTPVAGAAPPPGSCEGLVVVDLSSLWAGPLCGHLLQLAGARVIKVESETRPDGARAGPPAFFDLLHAGQEAVALDFGSAPGRTRLRRLLAAADVVIEASRPRALAQLDAGPEQVLPAGRPRLWVSITGYGRGETAGRRVAFGDDAAVAGGLVVWDGDGPCFCADALGDPAAGLFAAAGALAALGTGGRWILDVTMSGAAAFLAGSSPTTPFDGRTTRPLTAAAPRARHRTGRAAPPGRDTEEVMRELCPGC